MSEGAILTLLVCAIVVAQAQCDAVTQLKAIRKDLHGIAREIDEASKACKRGD